MNQARAMFDTSFASTLADAAGIEDASALTSASVGQKIFSLGTIEPPLHALLKQWSKPAVVALSLLACTVLLTGALRPADLALAVAAILVSQQILTPLRLPSVTTPPRPAHSRLPRLIIEWGAVIALLVFMGLTLDLRGIFPRRVLGSWFALTPILLLASDVVSARVAARSSAKQRRFIIVGANEVGVELRRRASQNVGMGTFLGFFDFRGRGRLPLVAREDYAGLCQEVCEFVREHAVNAIYITLPMSSAPRISEMLREFRDTTASIYFVPDIFGYDLVQARCVEVNGMPMLSICDTPFYGMNAVRKRLTDIVLASFAILLTWPLMLMAAVAVKCSSPGPVLFRQRRYGLNGQQILIYKFRSMRVCEDGSVVVQAKRDDDRTTAVGRFLRRSSLDELPQLFNVLEGTMSFVGPRPHAVAHNEAYRKLISGYMMRHKIRPGITGWAQVHGFRGETSTLEQMRMRVQFDLDYLRYWSLMMDLKILIRTAMLVIRDSNAY